MDVSLSNKNTTGKKVFHWGTCLLLTISGFSFLFFAGFPFGNHNESYAWLIILDKMSFWDSLSTRLGPVQSFRPFGTATAWLTYHLSNGIYLQQLINWAFACLSFAVLFQYAKNKTFFSIATFLATAGFFSGYIYLFHLHGVFYGPLQLYIAVLTCVAYKYKSLPFKKLLLLFFITIAAAFYHTFALLVFAAYLAGCMLQVQKNKLRVRLPLLLAFAALSLSIMYLILSMYNSKAGGDVVQGTLTSYTTTEINMPLSLLAAAFTIITVFTTKIASKTRQLYMIASVFVAALCIYLHIPVLLLWILACIVKMMLSRAWALAAIIFSTAIFPVATHTGTPTYIVFVIMVCVFVMAINSTIFRSMPRFFTKSIAGLIFLLALSLLFLKTGIKIPVIAKGLNPVLAEKEKTHQLETILAWKKATTSYANKELRFLDESAKPSASANAINRKYRPPTQQKYIDRYMNGTRKMPFDTTAVSLLITFGGKKINGRQPVFKVAGPWNGDAYVY